MPPSSAKTRAWREQVGVGALVLIVLTAAAVALCIAANSTLLSFLQILRQYHSRAAIGLLLICASAVIVIVGVSNEVLRPFSRLLFLLISVAVGLVLVTAMPRLISESRYSDSVPVTPLQARPNWSNAQMVDERLTGANLVGSIMTRATFLDVNLEGSNLSESDLQDAVFNDVNFQGVNLCGADLRGADLSHSLNLNQVSNWSFALYDAGTKMPPGWDWAKIIGPEQFVGTNELYMCTAGDTKLLSALGTSGR